MSKPLPCPFCGMDEVTVVQGSTFRWRVAECGGCGARCGEVRCQTTGTGTPAEWETEATGDAIAEWNTRATLVPRPTLTPSVNQPGVWHGWFTAGRMVLMARW